MEVGGKEGAQLSQPSTFTSLDKFIIRAKQINDSTKKEKKERVWNNFATWLKELFFKQIVQVLPPPMASKIAKKFNYEINVEDSKIETSRIENEGDENQERGNWSSHMEFLLSCIGFTVGLGNIWRFPYVCYRNGGGAFLLIYWVMSALVGFPIMLAEHCIGQYTSLGSLHCWQYAPGVAGAGFSAIAVSFLLGMYYDIIIVWANFYLFASFRSELPWDKCDYSDWADYRCEMQKLDCLTGAEHVRGLDGLCYNSTELGFEMFQGNKEGAIFLPLESLSTIQRNLSTVLGVWNETLATEWEVNSVLATAQYYHNHVLQDGDPNVGYSNFGRPIWSLALLLVLSWCIIFITLLNGIKTSGKAVYVTSTAPYAVLLVLIIRGATLPGAHEGLMYFLKPDFNRLKSPAVWYAAAGQLVYSIGVCEGAIITLASYNRFRNNVIRDALIVVFSDSFTSFMASLAIFSVIGYGAHLLERPIDKVADVGAGLAFIVYPKVLSTLPGAVFFSIIFFLMLMCVGLSSMVNTVETMYTSALDLFPVLRKSVFTKRGTLFAICTICFLLGLPFICPGGAKLLQVFDDHTGGWALFMIGILEVTSLCWIYGFRRFSKDLRLMINWIPELPAQIAIVAFWGFITPGMLTFIMVSIWVRHVPRADPREDAIGWVVYLFVAVWMPITAIWVIATGKGTFIQRLVAAFSPTEKWGPYLDKFRSQARHLEEFCPRKGYVSRHSIFDHSGMVSATPVGENYTTLRRENSVDSSSSSCETSIEAIEMRPTGGFPVHERSQPGISDNFSF